LIKQIEIKVSKNKQKFMEEQQFPESLVTPFPTCFENLFFVKFFCQNPILLRVVEDFERELLMEELNNRFQDDIMLLSDEIVDLIFSFRIKGSSNVKYKFNREGTF
jgi:hypothetical protein